MIGRRRLFCASSEATSGRCGRRVEKRVDEETAEAKCC